MEDEEDPTDEADDGGLTGVLLLRREQRADKPLNNESIIPSIEQETSHFMRIKPGRSTTI